MSNLTRLLLCQTGAATEDTLSLALSSMPQLNRISHQFQYDTINNSTYKYAYSWPNVHICKLSSTLWL